MLNQRLGTRKTAHSFFTVFVRSGCGTREPNVDDIFFVWTSKICWSLDFCVFRDSSVFELFFQSGWKFFYVRLWDNSFWPWCTFFPGQLLHNLTPSPQRLLRNLKAPVCWLSKSMLRLLLSYPADDWISVSTSNWLSYPFTCWGLA